MKLLWLLLLIGSVQCDDMASIRKEYHLLNSEEKVEKFIDRVRKQDCFAATPYLASAMMQRAEYRAWPTSKLSTFNEGKSLLETYIKNNPKDLEARYVRLLVQSEIPSILGYNSDMELDEKYIRENIEISGLPISYQQIILDNTNKVTND